MASDVRPTFDRNGKAREKVELKPGFHLMDWMRLTQAAIKEKNLGKIPPSEVKKHKTKYDCWTIYNGKVYNISQYLAYHPGGEPILMKVAGQDCTVQFNKFHKWVNIDSMLSKCIVGVLGDEIEVIKEEEEEDEEGNDDDSADNEGGANADGDPKSISSAISELKVDSILQADEKDGEDKDIKNDAGEGKTDADINTATDAEPSFPNGENTVFKNI